MTQLGFRIVCLDEASHEVAELAYDISRCAPLDREQLSNLMQRIKERFPPETDFSSTTDEEIAHYRNEAYAEWLQSCVNELRDCHISVRHRGGAPEFRFKVWNETAGLSRNVVVAFGTSGEFKVIPPEAWDYDEGGRLHAVAPLPRPPLAPRSTTPGVDPPAQSGFGHKDISTASEGTEKIWELVEELALKEISGERFRPADGLIGDLPKGTSHGWSRARWPADPKPEIFNGLIWVDEGRSRAASLEWEPGANEPQDFSVLRRQERLPAREVVSGGIRCVVAVDGSVVCTKHIPVRITITHSDVFSEAEALVARLCESGS